MSRIDLMGPYDLVINVESGPINRAMAALVAGSGLLVGPCLGFDSRGDFPFQNDERGDLWRDQNWVNQDVPALYPFLTTGFIAEIFIRLCYIDPIPGAAWPGGIPQYKFPCDAPPMPIPDILISAGASLASKLWPLEGWIALLRVLKSSGATVGLLGAAPTRQADFYHSANDESVLVEMELAEDLRGKLTLPQVVGAVHSCKGVVTIDNGILHIAAAFDKPTVGLFRPQIVNLWAPPNPNLCKVVAAETVADISLEEVLAAVQQVHSLA